MKPPRRARRVISQLEAVPVEGNEIEFPPQGAELDNVRVRFNWNGREYESLIFEEFLKRTEAISETS